MTNRYAIVFRLSHPCAVSTMQRMVNQLNTPQDSPELKKKL